MFEFVNWLRAAAAILITNSHYAEIWPISSLAFGGHLGNCLYFFLSGFCMYHVKESFPKWYTKRILRIYPSLWLACAVLFLIGDFTAGNLTAVFHCFVYPTWFHFIGTAMLLYVFFYLARTSQLRFPAIKTQWVMIAVFLVYIILYFFCFDKSYYHIDSVEEHWVKFQFTEAMLLGMLFREKYDSISEKITARNILSLLVLAVLYFGGKKILTSIPIFSVIQFVHPIILVLFVSTIGFLGIKLEKNGFFMAVHGTIRLFVVFLSGLTLEIYLIQYPIIGRLAHLPFPVNFLLVTALIIFSALILNRCSAFIQMKCKKLLHL